MGRPRKEIKQIVLRKQVQIEENEIADGWSKESADFINRLLQRKEMKRLGYKGGVKELKAHPWFNGFDWDKLYNKTMDDVRRRVAEIMLGYGNAKPTTATYKAKVIAKTNLNCRSGAGILFSRVGIYKPGSIITILEEKNGWGKTNSGWVSLQYIQKEN